MLLGVFVIAFDVLAAALGGQTMTATARRWFRQTPAVWIVVPVVLYLLAHMTVMPLRYDPLDRTYAWIHEKVNPSAPPSPPPTTGDVTPGNG